MMKFMRSTDHVTIPNSDWKISDGIELARNIGQVVSKDSVVNHQAS